MLLSKQFLEHTNQKGEGSHCLKRILTLIFAFWTVQQTANKCPGNKQTNSMELDNKVFSLLGRVS